MRAQFNYVIYAAQNDPQLIVLIVKDSIHLRITTAQHHVVKIIIRVKGFFFSLFLFIWLVLFFWSLERQTYSKMKIVSFSLRSVTFYYSILKDFLFYSFKTYNRNGKYFMRSFYNLQLKIHKREFLLHTTFSFCVLSMLLLMLLQQFFAWIYSQRNLEQMYSWKL